MPVSWPIEVAHGLACGAHRQVLNSLPWNTLGPHAENTFGEREVLARDWGVTTAAQWRDTVETLADPWPAQGDGVFAVRRSLAATHGTVGLDVWCEAIEAELARHQGGGDRVTAFVAEARRVDAYEDLLREHDLLARFEQVPSLAAWDWARGVNMVRDGLAAAWCDDRTAHAEIVRFSRLIREHYVSWTEFGVAFTLGRLLWSDDRYSMLDHYGSSAGAKCTLDLQHILTTEPESPWHILPFAPVGETTHP